MLLAAASLALGTGFKDSTDAPDSESGRAYGLLAQAGPGALADLQSGRIVWHSEDVGVEDDVVRHQAERVLEQVATLPGVTAVASPYSTPGAAQVNVETSTAYATVNVNGEEDLGAIREAAQELAGPGIQVAVGGGAFDEDPAASRGTEAVGLLAALVLLLLMFRSARAAVLPLVTGMVGVGVSLLLVLLGAHVATISASAITMGALIGLGVGIDYALLIVNRHRQALLRGSLVPSAAGEALMTAGRAVVFAGATVAVALLGMFVVGLGVLTSMAQAAALTVVVTVLAALTLLPALLGVAGMKVLSKRQRAELGAAPVMGRAVAVESGNGKARRTVSARWADVLLRHPLLLGGVAVVLVAVLAAPAASMRVGDADDTSAPVGSAARAYSDLVAPAFGAGIDAPLVLAASAPDGASSAAFDALVSTLRATDGVASVSVTATAPESPVRAATVVPTTSAQQEQTADLVNALRDNTIPAAEGGTRLQVYVSGDTASSIDLSEALLGKLPLYLGLIALLGFLLLALAFRSLLVPAVGALSNLATILVGLGAVTLIYQHGWGSEALGVGSGAPVMYIVPVMIVGIMFGLSMDYQVFLVSRIHEEWSHTRDNERAVRVGLAETGRVIATAATIMLCVFASFGFTPERIVSAIGIGLAVAVVVDAFLIRLLLVPAVMKGLGKGNWAYPRWAEAITPNLQLEGGAPAAAPAAAAGVPAATTRR